MITLVTGSNGFIGKALTAELIKRGEFVYGTVRSLKIDGKDNNPKIKYLEVADINGHTNWKEILKINHIGETKTPDCIIHCAARVHVMQAQDSLSMRIYNSINIDGTRKLAEDAASLGVRRFIYLSSVKVNGERTKLNQPFNSSDIANCSDPYSISKLEAENALHEVSAKTGLEIVIVRPPLVYGQGVGGNILRLLKLVDKGIYLPLSGIKNKRSMICLENLIDFLIICTYHPKAPGHTFLVSDGEDLSTPDFINRLSKALGKTNNLFYAPPNFLNLLGRVVNREHEISRLTSNLQIDLSPTTKTLGWHPVSSVNLAITQMVAWYKGLK